EALEPVAPAAPDWPMLDEPASGRLSMPVLLLLPMAPAEVVLPEVFGVAWLPVPVPVWPMLWPAAVVLDWACTPKLLNMAATADTASSPFKVLLFCILLS